MHTHLEDETAKQGKLQQTSTVTPASWKHTPSHARTHTHSVSHTYTPTGDVTAKQAKSSKNDTSVTGMSIMMAYLFFDGFTSTVQERLFKDIKVSTWNQMLYVGLLSALVTVRSLQLSVSLSLLLSFASGRRS